MALRTEGVQPRSGCGPEPKVAVLSYLGE